MGMNMAKMQEMAEQSKGPKFTGDTDEHVLPIGTFRGLLGIQNSKRALDLIVEFGGIDGGDHKQWVLDQIVRLLADDYDKWVAKFEAGEDGENTYEWDLGVAP